MTKEDHSITLAGDPDKFETEAAAGAHQAKLQKEAEAEGKDAPETKKGNPVSRFVMKFLDGVARSSVASGAGR